VLGNRCVVYVEPGKVSVESIDYPKLELPEGVPEGNRKCEHGVILKVIATNRPFGSFMTERYNKDFSGSL
jgi:glutathione-independent formaldehyde dehydrogenase